MSNDEIPYYATIQEWIKLSGIKRSTTYNLLAEKKLIGKKIGTRVLIDVRHGLEFIKSQPDANIHLSGKLKSPHE